MPHHLPHHLPHHTSATTERRVTIVTGASSGIGRACALLLARSGDHAERASRVVVGRRESAPHRVEQGSSA